MQWTFVLPSLTSSAHKNTETLRRRSEQFPLIILNQFPSRTTARYKTGSLFIDTTTICGTTPHRKWSLGRQRCRREWSMKMDQWGIQEVKMDWSDLTVQMSPRHWQLPQAHPHPAPSCYLKRHTHPRLHLSFDFFDRRPAHPNPLVRSIENCSLADLHHQYLA